MLNLVRKSQFKKDFKKLLSSGKNLDKLALLIRTLQAQEPLPKSNRDHALTGNYIGYRECHVSSDWLLIYQVTQTNLILVRTGYHSELFR